MSYTFGANNTDNIALSGLPTAPFATNRVGLCCCWVRPTNLVAAECIWSSGTIYRMAVASTTTSMVLTLDGTTTDGTYTAPMALATNKWTFVAVLWCMGTSPTAAVKMWMGTETTGPVEQTVTAVAGSGAWIAGATTFTVGNAGAGTSAIEGSVGGLVLLADSQNSNLNTICGIDSSSGAITQDQADAVRAAYVDACWRGDIGHILGMGRAVVNSSTNLGLSLAVSLDNSIGGGAWAQKLTTAPSRGTITTAVAGLRTPHSFDDQPNNSIEQRGGMTRTYLVRS